MASTQQVQQVYTAEILTTKFNVANHFRYPISIIWLPYALFYGRKRRQGIVSPQTDFGDDLGSLVELIELLLSSC